MAPFSNDTLSNMLSEAKPFRNVVKRYWTEEEVILFYFYLIQDDKLRTLVDSYGVTIIINYESRLKIGRELLRFSITGQMSNVCIDGKKY